MSNYIQNLNQEQKKRYQQTKNEYCRKLRERKRLMRRKADMFRIVSPFTTKLVEVTDKNRKTVGRWPDDDDDASILLQLDGNMWLKNCGHIIKHVFPDESFDVDLFGVKQEELLENRAAAQ